MESFLTLLGLAIIGCRDAAFSKQISRVIVELRFCQDLVAWFKNPASSHEGLVAALHAATQSAASSNDGILLQRCDIYSSLVKTIGQQQRRTVTSTESKIVVATLEAIETGLARTADAVSHDDLQRCEIEAEHIHNLPSTLNAAYQNSRRYYAETERKFFLDRLHELTGETEVAQARVAFERFWKTLDIPS